MAQDYLDFAVETALGAGEIIRNKYGRLKTWRTKEGRGDIVTEADTEAEDLIVSRIRAAFPSHSILTEESGSLPGDDADPTWYVDPLDGTGNYARSVPFFCTTLAVAHGNELLAGATYDPLRNEMFKAAVGRGAYLNDNRLKLSPDANTEDIMVSVSWSRRRPGSDKFPAYVARLAPHTSYLRRFGCAALAMAYVAAGRIDAYIQGSINAWDIAAGVLLVSEAGGNVTGFEEKPVDLSRQYSDIVTANPALHKWLLEEVLA